MNIPTEADSAAQQAAQPPATSSPPAPEPDLKAMQQTLGLLSRLFQITVAILVVLTTALNIYLLSQVSALRRQAVELNRQVMEMRQIVAEYEANDAPRMQRFAVDLQKYADTHPDFAPIMARYPKAAPPRAAGATPAPAQPAVAPATKK